MKKNLIFICAVALSLAVVSCKKEDVKPTSDISGTWNFVNLHVQTKTSNETNSGGMIIKTVTTSNYTTQNNTGTFVIDASTMTGKNMSYSVNTTANSVIYHNNVQASTFSFPFQQTIPSYTTSANYTRVNADSVYFPQGATYMSGVQGGSQPGGAKISVQNGTLTITQHVIQTMMQGGQPFFVDAKSVATFQR